MVRHGWYHHPENPMSPWHNWIAQPPPKGQVAGSTPAGDTTNVEVLRKRLKNSAKMVDFSAATIQSMVRIEFAGKIRSDQTKQISSLPLLLRCQEWPEPNLVRQNPQQSFL